GPEYSMSWNSLENPLRLFFSREMKGQSGEDLVEKQNAEMGLMPVISGEAAVYGYEAEDRHFVRVFLGREAPQLTFDDGLEVVKLLMTAYMSAEQGKTLEFPPKGLEQWQAENGGAAKWVVRDGFLEVAPHTGAIQTKRGFGDVQLHLEWAAPLPATGEGQDRGNSGVFLMTHYEVQVLDSYHSDT